MKTALAIILLLVAGLLVGPLWAGNTGYVLIGFGNWSVETSLVAAIIMVVVVLLVLQLIVRLVRRVVRRSAWGIRWFGERRINKAQQAYQQALVDLANQNLTAGLTQLDRAWHYQKQSDTALLAAHVSQLLGRPTAAQDWLKRAKQPASQVALADFLLSAKVGSGLQTVQLSEVRKLVKNHPEHAELIRMARSVYEHQHAWEDLRQLLPAYQPVAVSTTEFTALEHRVYSELFKEQGRRSADNLKSYWRGLDRQLRRHGPVRVAYVETLILFDQKESAGKVLCRGLQRNEVDVAEAIQRQLFVPGSNTLLHYLQEQIKAKPNDALLLHALGQLALHSNDYSLAQRALGKASENAPSPAVFIALAQAYQGLGDSQLALSAYQKALTKH